MVTEAKMTADVEQLRDRVQSVETCVFERRP
jgi:hypothetical protein